MPPQKVAGFTSESVAALRRNGWPASVGMPGRNRPEYTVAGVLGIINIMGEEISKEFIFTLIGIGYAGTDFIEGFIVKKA